MDDLQGISSFHGNINLPGLAILEYAPVDWLKDGFYEEIVTAGNNLQKAVPFGGTNDWLRAPVYPIQMNWTENPVSDRQGTPYAQTVSAIVPAMRPEVSGEFALMSDRPFLVKLTDRNGQPWLIGTPEHGLLFGAPAKTGTAHGDLNDYQISWSGTTARRAFGYVPVF